MNSQFTPIPGTCVVIDWLRIDPKYKFVTLDNEGVVEAYTNMPIPKSRYWQNANGLFTQLFIIAGNFSNWQILIFERPN